MAVSDTTSICVFINLRKHALQGEVILFSLSLSSYSETENNFWLGQHEDSLLFGRFDVNHTKPISYSIPYSLDAQRETEENNEDHEMLMQRFRQQTTLKVKGKDGITISSLFLFLNEIGEN